MPAADISRATSPQMKDKKPGPKHYIVSTDSTDHGDAFIDEGVARKHFERLSDIGLFVRLILADDGGKTELDRRNASATDSAR